jgi:hypothetical protein
MIASKVIRANRRHIIRADYQNIRPLLSSENVAFPKVGSLQSRSLRRLFPAGRMLSHREFDFQSHSYRLGSYIDRLRDKGWVIVNHDEVVVTKDKILRKANFTRYEFYAEFTLELKERIDDFCKAVDEFEARAVAAALAKKQVSDSAKPTQPRL